MGTQKPAETALVACEICLKEIPPSEAIHAEASDYLLHFCGMDCYYQWTERAAGDSSGNAAKRSRQP